MTRKNKYSHHFHGRSKNPQQPPQSDESSQPTRTNKPPLRLLPPLIEKQWTAEEIWALMITVERSLSMKIFSDTPEYWNSITPYFLSSSAEKLRKMYLSIRGLERIVVPWKKDEVETMLASISGTRHLRKDEPEDTPQWWGEIASNLPGRTALDCRVSYNTYNLSRWLLVQQQQERRQPIVPSITIDDVITSFERISIEPQMSNDKEKEQQEETCQPSVSNSTMDVAATFFQGIPEVAANTKSKEKKKKKKKKKKGRKKEKQHEETMEPSVSSSTIDVRGTSTNRTSEVPLLTLSKGKEKQQQEVASSDKSAPSIIILNVVGTPSERTSEASSKMTSKGKDKLKQQEDTSSRTFPGNTSTQTPENFSKTVSADSKMLQEQEEMWQHLFANSATFLKGTSPQTQKEFSKTTSNDKENHPQLYEIRQRSFESSTTFPWGTSSPETPQEIRIITFKYKEMVRKHEEMRPHIFKDSTTCTGDTSQKTSKDIPKTTSKDKEKLQQQEEISQHSFDGSTMYPVYSSSQKVMDEMRQNTFVRGRTCPRCISSQRSFVEPLKNWKLEDYFLLMKALTLNLHVDTDNACAMEYIASMIRGKTGDEVRHIILKWRPQLLVALEKADRVTGPSSGKKDLETSDSRKNDDAGNC